jgi:hypothetical protein
MDETNVVKCKESLSLWVRLSMNWATESVKFNELSVSNKESLLCRYIVKQNRLIDKWL